MKSNPGDAPLVSIIIPTYNRAELLPETLDSIIAQNYKNWECIVVDDGSTDNSIEVINKYVVKDPRFKMYKRPGRYRPGANGARNYGFDLSKGEFIQWFDSDDLMHKKLLSEKISIFNNHPEYQIIISQVYFFEDKNVLKRQTYFRKPYKLFFENTITWGIQVWTPSIMFRKQFLIDTNERFDESLKRLQDYDLFSRIFIKHPHNTYLLDKPLCYVRRNSEGAITTSFFNKKKVIELEKSEYIVANKIINLLINENKFSNNLENFFYHGHKKRISNLIRTSDRETIESFKSLVELFLTHNNKYFKLARFRLGLSLLKAIPIDNFFLIYRRPLYIKFIHINAKRGFKIFFTRGYLSTKIREKKLNKSLKIL